MESHLHVPALHKLERSLQLGEVATDTVGWLTGRDVHCGRKPIEPHVKPAQGRRVVAQHHRATRVIRAIPFASGVVGYVDARLDPARKSHRERLCRRLRLGCFLC